MLWHHLAGAEHHRFQDVAAGGAVEMPPDEEESGDGYAPYAAFTCDWSSADIIADYREECRRSDEVLAVRSPAQARLPP
jgi:hypothetical protein